MRGLAGVVRSLPGPGALGVGTVEGCGHRSAQRLRVDCLAAFQIGEQQSGGGGERRTGVRLRNGGRGKRRSRGSGCDEIRIHEGHPGERGREGPWGALSTPAAQTRPGRPFPLGRGRVACVWGSRRRHKKSPARWPGLRDGEGAGAVAAALLVSVIPPRRRATDLPRDRTALDRLHRRLRHRRGMRAEDPLRLRAGHRPR